MQARCTNHTDVSVEMLMPLPMRSIGERFRRALEMNRETVTTDAGIEGFVAIVQCESKPSAVILNRRIEIVDQELRCDSRKLCDTRYDLCSHSFRSSEDWLSSVCLRSHPRAINNGKQDSDGLSCNCDQHWVDFIPSPGCLDHGHCGGDQKSISLILTCRNINFCFSSLVPYREV